MRVVIINGRGGSGKDTVCDMARELVGDKCASLSTVDVVKDLAEMMFVIAGYGWDGKKDARGRRLLAQLKDAWQEYDEGPRKHVIDKVKIIGSIWKNDGLIFIHSREPQDIEELKAKLSAYNPVTLLVTRPGIGDYGNHADDDVDCYNYDYEIGNTGSLDDLRTAVIYFLGSAKFLHPPLKN